MSRVEDWQAQSVNWTLFMAGKEDLKLPSWERRERRSIFLCPTAADSFNTTVDVIQFWWTLNRGNFPFGNVELKKELSRRRSCFQEKGNSSKYSKHFPSLSAVAMQVYEEEQILKAWNREGSASSTDVNGRQRRQSYFGYQNPCKHINQICWKSSFRFNFGIPTDQSSVRQTCP